MWGEREQRLAEEPVKNASGPTGRSIYRPLSSITNYDVIDVGRGKYITCYLGSTLEC